MAEPRPRRRRLAGLLGTVRVRTTLGAVAVVGAALVLGAVALVRTMNATLVDEVRDAARVRAREVATALEAGRAPLLGVADPEEQILQVVDAGGRVVAASPGAEGLGPVADLRPGRSATVEVAIGDGDEFLVVAVGARTPSGAVTVLSGREIEGVTESTGVVARLLKIGLPVLLLVVGFTTWKVVGRALAPVEGLRREVDEISAAELHRRLGPTPGRDEIARLAGTMNRMLDRLEGSQARQRRFVSDASHELRSPVAVIRQQAEVALAHPERTTVPDLAEGVLAEDLRVQRLVEDLLVLARSDEHRPGRRQSVDVDDLVFEEARRLRESTDLRVDTRRVSAGRVAGDGAQLRRVLRNVGENAARHARGAVAFTLEAAGGEVTLAVEDDGTGIPAPDRQRVFERFVRLDDARSRDAGGAGLGLAIVAELVGAHGGSVAVTDSGLGGARVEIRLPAG